jgi:phosphatidylserine decarboxylase
LTSWIYGYFQKLSFSKKKIAPFIKEFSLDENSFEKKVEQFKSFNDFFIRKLKKNVRHLDLLENGLICPADGRIRIYPDFEKEELIDVKGRSLNLESLIDEKLPWKGKTAVVLIRLAPMDYHRFHFPVDGEVVQEKVLKGNLFSVNPLALKKNMSYLFQNKRVVSRLYHLLFHSIYMVEVGATHVGSIKQTYQKTHPFFKGEEKGYFEFGGSFIVLILQNDELHFDEIIVNQTKKGFETIIEMGKKIIWK